MKNFAAVVQAFRRGSPGGQFSGLAFECLLLCSEKPRTIAELESLTGCPNGRINTALRGLTPWWDAKTETVIRPAMHLLQRRRVINGKGHRYHLTSRGKALLNGASSAEP